MGRTWITRRRLQIALGLLWLFDGILQAQPSMFSAYFYGSMFDMSRSAPPAWLFDLQARFWPFVLAHAGALNTVFAAVQILMGLGLLWRRTVPVALAISIPWAVAVWLFGEAAGGIFVEGANALTGAPGPALLYAVAAVLLWPRRPQKVVPTLRHAESGRVRDTVAGGCLLGARAADMLWVAIWLGTAALEAESLNRMPSFAGAAMSSAGTGAPAWLGDINRTAGGLVGTHGAAFALSAGVVQAVVGIGILFRPTRKTALLAGMVLGLLYGVVGQDLGGIFTNGIGGMLASGATDPGTAPVIVLIALSLWPHRADAGSPAVVPAEFPAVVPAVVPAEAPAVVPAVVPAERSTDAMAAAGARGAQRAAPAV